MDDAREEREKKKERVMLVERGTRFPGGGTGTTTGMKSKLRVLPTFKDQQSRSEMYRIQTAQRDGLERSKVKKERRSGAG